MKTCLILLLTAALSFFAWYHMTGGNAAHGSLSQAADGIGIRIKNVLNDFQRSQHSNSRDPSPEREPNYTESEKKQKAEAEEPLAEGNSPGNTEELEQSHTTEADASNSANQTHTSPREEAIDILSGIVRLIDESH